MNRLINERSPYLQHAAKQEIDWYPWGEEAFEVADREDKPVFFSSGAVWCHWCHVMAKESFYDQEIAAILNRDFICVKLDRDERPDIDKRYQRAAAATGAGGGWPLTAFLTSDKKPFFLGTYFPPHDSYGRPGFKHLLTTIAQAYKTRRSEVETYAGNILAALPGKGNGRDGTISEELLEEATGLVLSQTDTQKGGFGKAPKFPMAGALEFLMQRYAVTQNGVIANTVRKTLEAMASGGFYDQLGGGFHRYSTDESWMVPHFEKMADDNAWLLRNYADGYALFKEERFARVTREIISYVRIVLSDPGGGFFASQDADVTPDDEGGYFTWTSDDFRNILSAEEHQVLTLHLMGEEGVMHHNPLKGVLYLAKTPGQIAIELTMSQSEVERIIGTGKAKLFKARQGREEPFIDRTLHTSLNGMFITAFLKASRVFKDEAVRAFALKSLARIIRERLVANELYHCEGITALFDDYAFLIEACIEAFEVTDQASHIELAQQLMDRAIGLFWDEENGGFFDSSQPVLGTRLKGIEDVPHPSANAVAIMALLKLSIILKQERYRQYAEMALKAFAAEARLMGVHGAYFFAALDAYYHMVSLSVQGTITHDLRESALARTKPLTTLSYEAGTGQIIPCRANVCFEPISTSEELDHFFDRNTCFVRE